MLFFLFVNITKNNKERIKAQNYDKLLLLQQITRRWQGTIMLLQNPQIDDV